MNLKQVFIGLLGACFVGLAWADDECYVKAAIGKTKVQGIKTGFEQDLFDHRYVEGGFRVNGSSRSYTFGIGCEINRYFAVELDRREGFKASVESRGSLSYKGLDLFDFHFMRFAEVEGYGLSVVGSYPLARRLWVTGRLGVLAGKERVGLASEHFPEDWRIVRERDGVLPIIGAGLRYHNSRRLAFTFEHLWYSDGNKFREWQGGIRYAF